MYKAVVPLIANLFVYGLQLGTFSKNNYNIYLEGTLYKFGLHFDRKFTNVIICRMPTLLPWNNWWCTHEYAFDSFIRIKYNVDDSPRKTEHDVLCDRYEFPSNNTNTSGPKEEWMTKMEKIRICKKMEYIKMDVCLYMCMYVQV